MLNNCYSAGVTYSVTLIIGLGVSPVHDKGIGILCISVGMSA